MFMFLIETIPRYLKQHRKDVKLKYRNVVIAGEIYSWLESHGLHPFLEGVHALQPLLKTVPLHYAPVRTHYELDENREWKQCLLNTFRCDFPQTYCQMNASKSRQPPSWSPCKCCPENIPQETWPAAPRECDWTAGTVLSSSSWELKAGFHFQKYVTNPSCELNRQLASASLLEHKNVNATFVETSQFFGPSASVV